MVYCGRIQKQTNLTGKNYWQFVLETNFSNYFDQLEIQESKDWHATSSSTKRDDGLICYLRKRYPRELMSEATKEALHLSISAFHKFIMERNVRLQECKILKESRGS